MATVDKALPHTQTAALPLRLLGGKQTALKFRDEILLALDTLRKNSLRSALTILGIVIGITTVITVTAVINGLNDNVLGGIRELGSDTIIAYRFPWASLSRPPSEWFTRKELQPEWADDIARLPHIKAASASMRIFQPMFGSGTEDVRRGAYRAKSVILQGNEPSIGEIFDLKIERGRFFNETDAEHRAPEAVDEMRDLLRRKRRLANDKPDDFAIFTPDYFLDLWKKISGLIFILMFAVASVGLIVGGIGVMNIMLVSVTERTREIGVRKAIGAKRANILVQFLIEAVTLSAIGGVIGVTFGSGITLLLKYGAHFPAALSLFWIITALVLCALIGIVFGVYPAWKAARLDPVEALRYE